MPRRACPARGKRHDRNCLGRYGRSAVPPGAGVTPGYKYALGNVGAAMGVVQLKKLAAFRRPEFAGGHVPGGAFRC